MSHVVALLSLAVTVLLYILAAVAFLIGFLISSMITRRWGVR